MIKDVSKLLLTPKTSLNENLISFNKNNREEPYLYSRLELNNRLIELSTNEKIGYYRVLKEDATEETPADELRTILTGNVKTWLEGSLNALVDYINKFTKKAASSDSAIKNYEDAKRENAKRDDPTVPLTAARQNFRIYHRPNLVDLIPKSHEIGGIIRSSLDDIGRICDGDEYTYNDNARGLGYKLLVNILSSMGDYREVDQDTLDKIGDMPKFVEFVKSSVVYITSEDVSFTKFCEIYDDKVLATIDDISRLFSGVTTDIETTIKRVKNTDSISADGRVQVYKLLEDVTNVVTAWVWLINTILEFDKEMADYYCDVTGAKTPNAAKTNIIETATIHGEPFDGDTLFDNEDLRDFNRTEWLDLALTTECYEYDKALFDYNERVALQEALILSEGGKPRDIKKKLIAMREAEDRRFGDKLIQIVMAFISIIDKFFAKAKDKLSRNAAYIKKWKTKIDQPINKLQDPIDSDGDILVGMERVGKKLPIKPYNFEAMKDNLVDEKTFFEKEILPDIPYNGGQRSGYSYDPSKMSIADYAKAYYGGPVTGDGVEKLHFKMADFEAAKPKILDFLMNSSRIEAEIRTEARSIRAEAEKVAKQAAAQTPENTQANEQPKEGGTETGNGGEAPQQNQTNGAEAANEGYYSILYGRYLNEFDLDCHS